MTLGPVRVMVAGVVMMLCVEEVSYFLHMYSYTMNQLDIVKTKFFRNGVSVHK